jgi:hypothetical protein
MNEKIKQLAIAAKLEHCVSHARLQEFAELIVRECLDIVNRHEYSYHEADPLWETAQLIKEHFRVE